MRSLWLAIALGCTGATPPAPDPSGSADVVGVEASGDAGAYTFSVTVRSPDTGCDQYADWWEVVTTDGQLVYRRILTHSHVDEQPFTRSGGPVAVQAADPLVIRAHLNTGGYGQVHVGSVSGGFGAGGAGDLPASIETADPQPDGCAF